LFTITAAVPAIAPWS